MTARSATTITKPATPGLVSHAHFNEIPIIDIGPLLANAQGALESVAAQIHHASTEVGFYFITNHGVSQEIVDRSFDASRKFHGMPAADKHEVFENGIGAGFHQGVAMLVRRRWAYSTLVTNLRHGIRTDRDLKTLVKCLALF